MGEVRPAIGSIPSASIRIYGGLSQLIRRPRCRTVLADKCCLRLDSQVEVVQLKSRLISELATPPTPGGETPTTAEDRPELWGCKGRRELSHTQVSRH